MRVDYAVRRFRTKEVTIFRTLWKQTLITSLFGLLFFVSASSAQGPCQPTLTYDDSGLIDSGFDGTSLKFALGDQTEFGGPGCGEPNGGYSGSRGGLTGCTGVPSDC
jgi:hypothetical protein